MGATVKIYGRGSDSLPQEQVNGSREVGERRSLESWDGIE